MRKRLLVLTLLLTLACALAPGLALADEGGRAAVPVTIEIGADGAPVGTSGDGWTYDGGQLVLEVSNAGIVKGGFFALAVVDAGGTMSACTFPVYASLTGLSLSAAAPESRAAGAVAIKKGSVAGPLVLAASGVPAVAPEPPTPEDPATPPANPAAPAPADVAKSPASPNAATFASTGDNALLQRAFAVIALAGGVLAVCSAVLGKRSRR